jgi:hypothetical protein
MTLDKMPARFDEPSAWRGPEMAAEPERWLTEWSSTDIAELEAAARAFLATETDIGEISAAAFPLPTLERRIRAMRDVLLQGCGVQVLRGLPIGQYDQQMSAAIFCGMGAHLGSARSQNATGHILGHVRDLGASSSNPNTRIYQTAERQSFHTDSADVVGLLCLRDAKEGGRSLLVSVEAIYNRMRADRPDLLARLFDPIATDRRGEVPEGADPFMTIPPLSWHEGHLTVFYQRQYIDSAQRFDAAPRLTPDHIAALDLFDALANDPEMHFAMQLQPGDMQFVYNHSHLHDRTAFVDWPDVSQRRHLLRLWLSIPGDRPLPPVFAQRYGSIEVGQRGGIITAETRLHAPLDPPAPVA